MISLIKKGLAAISITTLMCFSMTAIAVCAPATNNNSATVPTTNQQPQTATTNAATMEVKKPSNLAAAYDSYCVVKLTWTDNSTNETGFAIERKTGPVNSSNNFAVIAQVPANSTSYINNDSGSYPVGAECSYTYRVKATGIDSDSLYSNTVTLDTHLTVTAPKAPEHVKATTNDGKSVSLVWDDKSNNEDSFSILRKKQGGAYTSVATAAANSTHYTDFFNMENDVKYYYRVQSVNSGGSTSSWETSVTYHTSGPSAPAIIHVDAISTTSLKVSWKDNANNEDEYYVLRKDSADGQFNAAAPVHIMPANATNVTDNGLKPGKRYWYQVCARNNKAAAYSQTLSQVTQPNPPVSFSAQAVSTTQVKLTWTQNNPEIEGFMLYRQKQGGGLVYVCSMYYTTTSYTDKNLVPGTNYTYSLKCFNLSGKSSVFAQSTVKTPAKVYAKPVKKGIMVPAKPKTYNKN
ncbi:MAG: fibronectin type III domain-containing protein [Acidobacteriota bacterium]